MVPHMGHTELGIAVVGVTYGYVVVPGRADWEWVEMKKDSDERVMCVTIQSHLQVLPIQVQVCPPLFV